MKKRWKDNNPEMGMLNFDLNWEEYGLPKATENVDYNLPPYIKGSGRKPSNRKERIRKTNLHKKKIAKANKNLGNPDKFTKLEKIGARHIGASVKHQKCYDSLKTEQQKKLARKEIKNCSDDILTFEDKYLYPLKRNYFNPLFGEVSYCCSDTKKGITDNIFCLPENASTPVKEVLFDCLLNS